MKAPGILLLTSAALLAQGGSDPGETRRAAHGQLADL